MRIEVEKLLEDSLISESYFKKILTKCKINEKIFLDEFDLKKLYEYMPVKTYKTKHLLLKIKKILNDENYSFIN